MASDELRVTNYELRVTNYEFQIVTGLTLNGCAADLSRQSMGYRYISVTIGNRF